MLCVGHLQLHREEGPVARRIEHARLPDDHVLRQPGHALELRHHRIEGIGDRDHEGIRRVLLDGLADGGHDARVDLQEIIAAHAGFARRARGHHDTVRALDGADVGGAGDVDIDIEDRRRFEHVERLALRQSVDDVIENDVAERTQEA